VIRRSQVGFDLAEAVLACAIDPQLGCLMPVWSRHLGAILLFPVLFSQLNAQTLTRRLGWVLDGNAVEAPDAAKHLLQRIGRSTKPRKPWPRTNPAGTAPIPARAAMGEPTSTSASPVY
jgi:hypothetical protein